jgi:preprotein translocase subunit SecD/SecD/SecF fusion protein
MLHFPRWQVAIILFVVTAGFLSVIPNFFSREQVQSWPGFLPNKQMVLGLDLQGGAYLLYEVDRQDYVQKRLKTLVSDVRKALLQEPRIGYTGLAVQGETVQLRIRDLDKLDEVKKRLQPMRNALVSSLLGGGTVYEFDLTVGDDGLTRFTYSTNGMQQRVRGIVSQAIEVINRRINQLGTTEPSIQRQGDDRILVEAPGLGDPARLKALVGQTAQLTFHLVRKIVDPKQAAAPEAGTVIFPSKNPNDPSYEVEEQPLMTGEDLTDAQAAFHQQTNEPVVNFRLSTGGAQKFGDVTTKNVDRLFAIVLDNQVIEAPRIREPILGGSGEISGSFTVQTANDLAILLRAGSLPAKLTIVEERTIGPSLGRDSIRAGIIASIVATIAIGAFMVVCYGILGLFADLAMIANNFLMLGILTLLGATLTLPGIAGIVLTMGMAVDANVLIYERMREEAHAGRSTVAAIDTGFRRAFGTIIDAHLTAFIAAVALFLLGSGPIRGFAVTLAIGIISTLFTAYLVTRLIVATWYSIARPKVVPL